MKDTLLIIATILSIYGGSMFFPNSRIEDQSLLKLPALFIGIVLLFAILTS